MVCQPTLSISYCYSSLENIFHARFVKTKFNKTTYNAQSFDTLCPKYMNKIVKVQMKLKPVTILDIFQIMFY